MHCFQPCVKTLPRYRNREIANNNGECYSQASYEGELLRKQSASFQMGQAKKSVWEHLFSFYSKGKWIKWFILSSAAEIHTMKSGKGHTVGIADGAKESLGFLPQHFLVCSFGLTLEHSTYSALKWWCRSPQEWISGQDPAPTARSWSVNWQWGAMLVFHPVQPPVQSAIHKRWGKAEHWLLGSWPGWIEYAEWRVPWVPKHPVATCAGGFPGQWEAKVACPGLPLPSSVVFHPRTGPAKPLGSDEIRLRHAAFPTDSTQVMLCSILEQRKEEKRFIYVTRTGKN